MAEESKPLPEPTTPIEAPGTHEFAPELKTTLPWSLPPNAEPELVHAVVAGAHVAAPIEGRVVTDATKIEPLNPDAAANCTATVEPPAK